MCQNVEIPLHWIRLVALPVDISIVLNRASGFHTRILISLQVLFVFVDFFFGNSNLFFFITSLIVRHSFFTCDTLKRCIFSDITNGTKTIYIYIAMGAILWIELCIRCEPIRFESRNAFHKCKRLLKATKFCFFEILFSSISYLQPNTTRDCIWLLWVSGKEKKPYAMQTIPYTVQCHVVFYVCANVRIFRSNERNDWDRWENNTQKEREGVQGRKRDRKKEQTGKSEHYKRLARCSANWYARICV